jgi:hypothetical protein
MIASPTGTFGLLLGSNPADLSRSFEPPARQSVPDRPIGHALGRGNRARLGEDGQAANLSAVANSATSSRSVRLAVLPAELREDVQKLDALGSIRQLNSTCPNRRFRRRFAGLATFELLGAQVTPVAFGTTASLSSCCKVRQIPQHPLNADFVKLLHIHAQTTANVGVATHALAHSNTSTPSRQNGALASRTSAPFPCSDGPQSTQTS